MLANIGTITKSQRVALRYSPSPLLVAFVQHNNPPHFATRGSESAITFRTIQITHVFNLDLPIDGEGYVHRGGRAGRLGRPGKVISIVTPAQEFVIRRLGNGIGVDIKRINLGSKKRNARSGE